MMANDEKTLDQMILSKLQEHDELFREMISSLAAITERITNYPDIVSQTAENMRMIVEQTKRCSDIQEEKNKRQSGLIQIKRDLFVGITVGVSVFIVTALILGGVK